jgi:hypothetical protein
MSLWRAYEVMETKSGNVNAAQQVYQRSIKDAILRDDITVSALTQTGYFCMFGIVTNQLNKFCVRSPH